MLAKKILVVEDELIILKVLAAKLKKQGYEVSTAADGQEALTKIQALMPDLVLLDIKLPTKDGYEIYKQVKEDEKLKDIPIILLTAGEIKNGMEDYEYIIKPFEMDELLAKIKRHI